MTDHHRIRFRKLLLRKPYGLRYAVIAGVAAAACCGLQWPAVAMRVGVAVDVTTVGPCNLRLLILQYLQYL